MTVAIGSIPDAPGPRSRGSSIGWCGCLLLALYVVPLYLPPGPVPMSRLAPDVGLLTRLFPDVPGWWVVTRLTALGLGAALLAWAGRSGDPIRSLRSAPRPGGQRTWLSDDRYEWAALGFALVLVLAATQAARFSRSAQIAFVFAPVLPIMLLGRRDAQDGARAPKPEPVAPGWWAAVLALVAGWVVWRVGLGSHDPRAADFVDMWKNFSYFLDAANKPSNLLTQTAEPGVSSVYMLAVGIPFVGPGKIEPSFAWLQWIHALWIALAAGGVACLVRRFARPAAMLGAVAVMLFSPFMMSMAVSGVPFGFTNALATALVLLVCRIRESDSRADVVALGALAGFCGTHPHLTLFGLASTLAVLPRLLRGRPSLVVWATAALIAIAIIVPTLASLADLPAMRALYLGRRGVVAELEPLIRGQKFFPMPQVDALWHAGVRGVLDVPLAALLQPFAIPRTPVRLSGDVYYEPIGAALAAVGLVAGLGAARRSAAARLLLGMMIVALLPGATTSAFDRASLTRNLAVPVLLPVFSAVGLGVVSRAIGAALPDRRACVGFAIAVVLSGIVIFDVVDPRIVAASWQGLTLRALTSTSADDVMLFEHGHPRRWWMYVPEIARHVPPRPLATRPYLSAGSLLADPERDDPAASLIFWSPGLEEEESIRQNLCGCWPDTTLYTLHDRSGLSAGFAARLRGAGWEPALPRTQWTVTSCTEAPGTRISCQRLRAMAHYDEAHLAAEAGRADEAIGHLREALWLAPDWVVARNELGLALASRGRLVEAIAEFHEVLRARPDAAAAHNGLAIALETAGRTDEAIVEYRAAVRLAPAEPRGRLNLAAGLTGQGKIDEAIPEYREVLRLAPDLPEGHLGLGDAFARQGRARDAAAEYRAALLARPRWRPALLALTWLLATTDDPDVHDPAEALSLAAQAVGDDGAGDIATLRTLAVAYAATQRFEEAAATAERALEIARAAGRDDIVRELGERVAAYRTGRALP